jgi:uncharacterized protein YejL (UPF0352 family)
MTFTTSADVLCQNVRMLPVTVTDGKLLTEIENVLNVLNSMVRHCLRPPGNIDTNTSTTCIPVKCYIDLVDGKSGLTEAVMAITTSADALCRNVRLLPVTATHGRLLTEIENVLNVLNSMVKHCLRPLGNIDTNTSTTCIPRGVLDTVKCYIDLVDGQSLTGLTETVSGCGPSRRPLVPGPTTTSSALSSRLPADVVPVKYIDIVASHSGQSIPSFQLVSDSNQKSTTTVPSKSNATVTHTSHGSLVSGSTTTRSALSSQAPAVIAAQPGPSVPPVRATKNVSSSRDIPPLERSLNATYCKRVRSTLEDNELPPQKAEAFHFGFTNW